MPPRRKAREAPTPAPPEKSLHSEEAARAMRGYEVVGHLFQQVHLSAANIARSKKALFAHVARSNSSEEELIRDVCNVVLTVLKQVTRIPTDQMKRHYTFLSEVSKAYRDHYQTDHLAIELLKAVQPYANANDKAVRIAVVSTFDALLKTVDQRVTNEVRQDFYQCSAEMLKQRVHDKCPQVRERAVAAVACFQTGKKDCDVTQQLVALLCTDSSADVRRQILRSVVSRKEFLEGYFHGLVRSTRDVVARVRAEAWDALSRFPWKYITAYGIAKRTRLHELLAAGLADINGTVQVACRAAVTNSWLQRDCKGNAIAFLEPLTGEASIRDQKPYDVVCGELLQHCRKHAPRHQRCSATVGSEVTPPPVSEEERGPRLDNPSATLIGDDAGVVSNNAGRHGEVLFQLPLQQLTIAAAMMWKSNAKFAAEAEGDDEAQLLPPLGQFTDILQDLVYAYARPEVGRTVVQLRNVEDAENLLRVFLSVFDIYDDCGYLAHTDNTTRKNLIRVLGFLLKVVPDDEPDLFVDIVVRSLKTLTVRTPEEASTVITAALDALFRSLQLVKTDRSAYVIAGYDDIEGFRRLSCRRSDRALELERKKEHLRRADDSAAYEECHLEHEALCTDIQRDEKFLLRMQYIVFAFLSSSQRNDEVPLFCSHVIQLGRLQIDESVAAASTKSLGLQCLINPEAVHTFLPLILSDALEANEREGVADGEGGSSVAVASLGVAFDLVMEYGLKFFSTPSGEADGVDRNGGYDGEAHGGLLTPHTGACAVSPASDMDSDSDSVEPGRMAQRYETEKQITAEDTHKVGSSTIFQALMGRLKPSTDKRLPVTLCMAIFGFCKLLSANRVPRDAEVHVLAELLLHFSGALWQRKSTVVEGYIADLLDRFFRSYAASHPRRQATFAEAGFAAFRVLLQWNVTAASRMIDFVLRHSDAYMLTQIRDIDPDAVRKVKLGAVPLEGAEGGELGAQHSGPGSKTGSPRTTTTRGSTQSGRMLRELARFSLHEYIASELIVEIEQNAAASSTCLDVLYHRLYFYGKDAVVVQRLRDDVQRVASSLADHGLAERLQLWMSDVASRVDTSAPLFASGALPLPDHHAVLVHRKFEDRVTRRNEILDLLFERGFSEIVSIPPQAPVTVTPAISRKAQLGAPTASTGNAATDEKPVKAPAGGRTGAKRKAVGIREPDFFGVEVLLQGTGAASPNPPKRAKREE